MPGKSNLHEKCNRKSGGERVKGLLYSRWRDGADKVKVTEDGYKLFKPGYVQTFTSARQLLIAITGHPKARNWTFDRYFKTGRHANNLTLAHNQPRIDVFDLLDLATTTGGGDTLVMTDTSLAVTPDSATSKPQVSNFITTGSSALGIDLVNRAHEVAKLFYAGFGQRVYAAGYDPEDVLQEVYKGLLTRNKGRCPWDARKSSFGHYVHMVCRGVVSNYHRKMTRRRAVERIGAPGWDHGDLTSVDVSSSASLLSNPLEGDQARQTGGLEVQDLVSFIQSDPRSQTRDGQLALRLLPYVEEGYSRAEMSDVVGVSKSLVSRALALIRTIASDWKKQGHS